jgi:vancomycin resistance protein YoaR
LEEFAIIFSSNLKIMIKIAMMLLKHQQINLKNGNTSNTEEINNTSSGENNNTPENTSSSSTPVEKTLATFSTKIYSKDSARQNNIKITCNSLNNTTVKNGSTFSFCNTVGQATSAKGYQKADIFDKDGNKKKGLGRR